MSASEGEVIRWYTRARRFPKFIGKLGFSDKPLIGGPYPVVGVIGFVVAFIIGANTMELWGGGSLIWNAGLLFGISLGVGFASGKLVVGGRNPVTVLQGSFRAFMSPKHGDFCGRPVRISRPQRVSTRLNILLDSPPAPNTLAVEGPNEPASAPKPAGATSQPLNEPTSPLTPPEPLTGVQALLAAAGRQTPNS